MVDFPAGDPDIPTAALTGETLATMHGGVGHPAATNRLTTNIKELARKLGYGASLPGALGGVLRRVSATDSAWGPLVNADVDPAAAIALAKLAAGSAGFLKSNGSAISAGNVLVDADFGTNLITARMIQDGAISSAEVGLGANGIHGNRIVPDSITATEIAASAIGAAELAAGAATKIAAGSLDGNSMTLTGGFQTCTGTACSITVNAGSSLLVMFCGEPTCSGSANLYFQLTGATNANSNASAFITPTRQNVAIFNYFNPNAGAHTVSMMVAGSGVFNANAATTVATILAIELKKPG